MCLCVVPDQSRYTLSVFAMGNACSNHLGIPPAKGPNAVGCTDFMMDHTAQVKDICVYVLLPFNSTISFGHVSNVDDCVVNNTTDKKIL